MSAPLFTALVSPPAAVSWRISVGDALVLHVSAAGLPTVPLPPPSLLLYSAAVGARRHAESLEADIACAVQVGSTEALAAHLRGVATRPLDAGCGAPGVLALAVIPAALVPIATGLTLALDLTAAPGGTAAPPRLPLPPALLLAQLPFLLDGAILGLGCSVPVRIAGVALRLRITRATPTSARLMRCAPTHTRLTLEGPPFSLSAPSGTAAPVSAPLSPWKQPLGPGPGAVTGSPLSPWKQPLSPGPNASVTSPRPSNALAMPASPQLQCSSPRTHEAEVHSIDDEPAHHVSAAGVQINIAGMDAVLARLYELVVLPSTARGRAARAALHVTPPRGILLHGPPGCGKTALARALAAGAGAPSGARARAAADGAPHIRLLAAAAGDLASSVLGEPERRLRQLFADAHAFVRGGEAGGVGVGAGSAAVDCGARLAIIFLDEVDAICPAPPRASDRGGGPATSSAGTRLALQLLSLLDEEPEEEEEEEGGAAGAVSVEACGRVMVLAATNRPDALHPALRRPGRLDREFAIPPPDASARRAILRLHAAGLQLSPEAAAGLDALAEGALGFAGADLAAVCREASSAAMQRMGAGAHRAAPCEGAPDSPAPSTAPASATVELVDLQGACGAVGASCLRDARPPPSKASWSDIGGAEAAVAALRSGVELPLAHAPLYARMGLRPPRGLLLHGPPGNAKTTLVRALAGAVRASFLSLSGADVYSPYVGESERAVRGVFAAARAALPCVIFLDEIDALVGRRGGASGGGGGGGDVSRGVLATLLTEMDGIGAADGILVVGATNRPDALDPALLRPGRLELHILVPPPDAAGAAAVLAVHTRAMPLDTEVQLPAIARALPAGLSGAQLEGIAREAAMAALREALRTGGQPQPQATVAMRHWRQAVEESRQHWGGQLKPRR